MSTDNEQTCQRRILLAEDDPAFREVLGEHLLLAGHEVVEVATGTALLDRMVEAARERRFFDLFLSDNRMPGKSGLEVLETTHGVLPRTPFLLFTAFGDADVHRRARDLGASVVNKPFDLDEFLERVEALLASEPVAGGTETAAVSERHS